MKKNGLKLFEFSNHDEIFNDYCKFVRDYNNIKMIGRQEYLLSMDNQSIADYLFQLNQSPNDSFFAVSYEDIFIGTVKIGHIDWRIGTGDLGIMIGNINYRGKNCLKKFVQLL